jgi:hypothetical protein
MTNPLVSGIVQSGGSGAALPLAGAIVYLWRATEGEPFLEGAKTTGADGRFEVHVSRRTGEHVYYATAMRPGGVLLVNVVGPELRDFITINELTTVAAAYSMAQFTDGIRIAGNVFGLRIAAMMNDNLVSPPTGDASEVMLNSPNANETNSLQSMCALANLLAASVRGQPGAWDTLRRLTTMPGGDAPTNTFQAMVNIPHYPAYMGSDIYTQAVQAPQLYTPTLLEPPDAWTLAVKVNRTGGEGERSMFGGPANIAFDRNGYAWIANNVFQGGPCSGDFVVVLKPDGTPADGVDAPVRSPVTGGGLLGPGFGIAIDGRDHVWVGSFGWGPENTWPTAGIVSEFDEAGAARDPYGYTALAQRVQAVAVDAGDNVWLASYGNDSVVVYPKGDPLRAFAYPSPGDARETAPGTCTFGVATDLTETGEETAWVTYSGGLGWPPEKQAPAYVARFRIETVDETSRRLVLVRAQQVGDALKGNAVDRQGSAWLASGGDSSVYRVTKDWQITRFSGYGGSYGGLDAPWGVAVDGGNDVWVANFGKLGIGENYTSASISLLAGEGSPSGQPVGMPLTPDSGYTLKTGGDPVRLPDGSLLYDHAKEPCTCPLMRLTSVTIDQAGNVWACNNWKPRFGTDFPPAHGNPGGDGIVIFVGLAKPPAGRTDASG